MVYSFFRSSQISAGSHLMKSTHVEHSAVHSWQSYRSHFHGNKQNSKNKESFKSFLKFPYTNLQWDDLHKNEIRKIQMRKHQRRKCTWHAAAIWLHIYTPHCCSNIQTKPAAHYITELKEKKTYLKVMCFRNENFKAQLAFMMTLKTGRLKNI